MKLDWLHRRVREIVGDVVDDALDPELERLLVGDAVISRKGDHYRIESGGETWEELERLARELGSAPCRRSGRRHGPEET